MWVRNKDVLGGKNRKVNNRGGEEGTIIRDSRVKTLLKTAKLLSKHFPSGLSFCILYFIFHKGKDTSAIPQPSVQHLMYVFPIFFRFYKCFNNFHLSKNILINKFFH